MPTLKEIVETEPRVLIDTSGMPIRGMQDRFINSRKVEEFIAFLKETPNVYTIPECVQELEPIKKNEKRRSKKIKTRKDISSEKVASKAREKSKLVKRLINTLKGKTLHLEEIPQYCQYRNIIFQLEDRLGIKGRFRKHPKKESPNLLRTDEKMVAAAFFYTVCSESGTTIIANDSDYKALLISIYDALSLKFFEPENKHILESLRKKGIKLYGEIKDDYELRGNTTKYNPKGLYIPCLRLIGGIKNTLKGELTPISN